MLDDSKLGLMRMEESSETTSELSGKLAAELDAATAPPPGEAPAPTAGGYKVRLDMFEGPLDLLLHLIRKEEVSIYDIPIARITEQYLEYLTAMQQLDIGVAGEFLVMAATLIHIKSRMLLPRDPDALESETEDPRIELVNQLLEHQKFKAAANALYQRAIIENATFTRGPLETDDNNPEVAATIFQLFEVFREVLNRQRAITEMEIARDQFSMAEKIDQIKTLVASGRPVRARELFESARSKHEMVLIFLGILELVKELVISLVQQELFGEIILAARPLSDHVQEIPAGPDPVP
jgi:segregation and condensation protein A